MSSLKISSSRSSSSHSIEQKKPEPVVATSPKPAIQQLASRTQKATTNSVRRKSYQLGDGRKEDVLSPKSNMPKLKPSAVLQPSVEKMRKASSIQSFSKSDTQMKRTQSAQNIPQSSMTSAPLSTCNANRSATPVKRALSTQNVSNKGRQRLSAPVSAMAYNAGLLASFEKEKKTLERRISELIQVGEVRKTENEKLKIELRNYKENVYEELELLRKENNQMREQLVAANISLEHFTDAEKLTVLQNQNNCLHETLSLRMGGSESSAKVLSASEVDSNPRMDVESVEDPSGANVELRSCISLDANWDKQSNKSSEGGQSEVASLQDRILQMEETHYSTNEELQATLQELTDLQDTVNELSNENELLADEKHVLLTTLCSQTSKLENARLQIDQLKSLLISNWEARDRSEVECQLVGLIRTAEDEKEELLLKQVELSNRIQTLENENHGLQEVVALLKDKNQADNTKLESLSSNKKTLDGQLGALKEQGIKDMLEIQHLRALLENEKTKLAELEQERSVTSKSELEALLDTTRQEKDRLEDRLTDEGQELSMKRTEIAKLEEMLESTRAELNSLSDSFESQLTDMKNRLTNAEEERSEVLSELDAFRVQNDQLQLDCDQFEEEKETYTLTVARAESELRTARSKITRLEAELKEKTEQFLTERDTWKQFQCDLQMAVVIANELKTETQEDLEKIILDKEHVREQNLSLRRDLEAARSEIERLKQEQQQRAVEALVPVVSNLDIRGKVLSTVDREFTARRQGRILSDAKDLAPSFSVKHLVSSIEEQVKNKTGSTPVTPPFINPVPAGNDSTDATRSLPSAKPSDLPARVAAQRQLSGPSTESSLKSVVRRSNNDPKDIVRVAGHRHTISGIRMDSVTVTDDDKQAVVESRSTVGLGGDATNDAGRKPLTGILSNKSINRRKTTAGIGDVDRSPDKPGNHMSSYLAKADPLALLAKQFNCSKRNALLKWCQNKTATYAGIDITNFSSSWNDGLAFCALLHTFLPDMIPYKELNSQDKVRNFTLAFKAADSVGVANTLNLTEMLTTERPDWQAIMSYVTNIYRHFEVDNRA